MDLEYLRAHPRQLPMFIEHQRIRFTPVTGGSNGVTQRLTLDDGSDVFAKLTENGPAGQSTAEANGLAWLAAAGAPVPQVWCVTETLLVTDWLEPAEPSPQAATRLGQSLAKLHRSGADRFGADWPGFIGPLPLDNRPPDTDADEWSRWFTLRRLEPFLKLSRDRDAVDGADVIRIQAAIERLSALAPPSEPIARLHGDLWPGNLHWTQDQAWLIDPAAQGGHRETDLATLALWGGPPYFEQILAGYQDEWPLADGWRDRLPLHQLHLLLVHTAVYGRRYRDQVLARAPR